jgi:tRNA threonylcarbamoyladenosine biosynthesis protein TsaB
MNVLYIDTVTEWMVVGIFLLENSKFIQVNLKKEKVPREGGIKLSKYVNEMLSSTNILKPDAIIVVSGPGSFTGIRIGVSFARALSQGYRIPCLGINSIELYSHYYFTKFNSKSSVFLDGRMKKVYGGAYSERGFEICVDLPFEEAKNVVGIEYSKVITDFTTNEFLLIDHDFPEPLYFLNKISNTIQSLNYNENNYTYLLPNYMRGTYVDGKKE